MKLETELGTLDPMHVVQMCLNCESPECKHGICAKMQEAKIAERYKERKLQRQAEECERVTHDFAIQEVVRLVRNGATDKFIMRELGLTKEEYSEKRRAAVKAGILYK